MSIDDRISDALFDYCIAWRDRASAVQDKVETELRAAIERHVAEAVKREREEWRPVLDAVVREFDHRDEGRDGNAPGHGHSIPGVWDEDNGPIAGTPCAWCATWKIARELLADDAADGGRAMSEDRPQYQAANKSFVDPTPTPIELAKKLRYLSNDIMVLSAEIQYVGGFGQMANISEAMELSARNLRAWAYDIEEAQG